MSHGEAHDAKDVKVEVKEEDKLARTSKQSNNSDIEDIDEHKGLTDFVASHGLTTAEAEELLIKWGRNELPEKSTPKWLIYLRGLWGPMPIMIWIAAIIELALENWADGGILMGILFTNATISYYETTKAGDAVAALKASLKPQATCKRDGKWAVMNAALIVPGDLVLLGSGSAVPADCIVNEGQIEVDQAALTGESLPATFNKGGQPKMGSTVVRGEIEATVEFTGANTFFGKTAALIQSVDGLGHLQMLLLKIMGMLVILSLVLCFTAFGYLMGKLQEPVRESLSFTVVLLVASIPVAIEIVVTTTLALGSRQLSGHGAIVTRLSCIEELAGMNMLCSDKTGTLTLNKMEIQEYCPCFAPGLDREKVLILAALAAKWREPPRDALDTMVLTCADLDACDAYKQTNFTPFDPTTKKTEAALIGPDGKAFKVAKGAPHVIMKLVHKEMRDRIEHGVNAVITDLAGRGIRSLSVAKTNDEGLWELQGILTFLDPPRPDTKRTIERALENGVDVKMITGDHGLIAKEMCRMIGLNTNILTSEGLPTMDASGHVPKDLGERYGDHILACDGFAQVFPEHKFLIVEALRQRGFAVGMTGDGVNDAPALKRADIGVAVSGATDAARAAADIVLTEPGLAVVIEAIVIARMIFQRMKSFINYRISATLQLLVFFFISVFAFSPSAYQIENSHKHPFRRDIVKEDGNFNTSHVLWETVSGWNHTFYGLQEHHEYRDLTHQELGPNIDTQPWPAFFSLPVLMLMLITLLNDGTLISIGYDRVIPSERPEKWNLPALWLVSVILGGVACVSSLIMVWACLDSYNPNGLFRRWDLPPMEYGKIVTAIYLKVSISDFLTLFAARVHEDWFWASMPSPLLLGGGIGSLGISTLLACIWPEGKTDKIPTKGLARGKYTLWPLWVWIYCIVWWFIQDSFKVLVYFLLKKYDIFHYTSGKMVNAYNQQDPMEDKAAVGRVEAKNLAVKLEHVSEEVDKLHKKSGGGAGGANLHRVSQNLNVYRKSLTGYDAPEAIKTAKAEDVERIIKEAEDQMKASGASDEEIAQARKAMRKAREAADRLQRVSQMLGQKQAEADDAAANPNLVRRLSGKARGPEEAHAGSSYAKEETAKPV